MKLNILVLYDGGGLARLGLEQSGHICTGVELDPVKHEMSKYVGSGNCICADVLALDDSFYLQFDAIWSSPPCQSYSDQKTDDKTGVYGNPECLPHSMKLIDKFPHLKAIWIENVLSNYFKPYAQHYNAAQFLLNPVQRRRRLIGGRFDKPFVYRGFKYDYPEFRHVPPAPMASELKAGGLATEVTKERRKFSKWYRLNRDRRPTTEDMAVAQGFSIPDEWAQFSTRQISQAIGNGVPVYMAKAFGDAYSKDKVSPQLELPLIFDEVVQ